MNRPHMPPPPPPPPPPPAGKSGTPWLKYVLIGCGGLLLVCILAFAGLAFWISRNADDVKASLESVVAEGEQVGRGTDQAGCIEKAKEYGGGGIRAALNVPAYVDGCMRTARETPNFCADVPRPTEFRRTLAYQNAQCRGSAGASCQSVMQAKIEYCDRAQSRGPTPEEVDAASPPDLTPPVDIDSVRAEVESETR